jgi:hypothetical protein
VVDCCPSVQVGIIPSCEQISVRSIEDRFASENNFEVCRIRPTSIVIEVMARLTLGLDGPDLISDPEHIKRIAARPA